MKTKLHTLIGILIIGWTTAQAETIRYGIGGSNDWVSYGIADNTDTGTGGLD